MTQLTRRTVLAGGSAVAVTALAPFSMRNALAQTDCLRPLKAFRTQVTSGQQLTGAQRELLVDEAINLLEGIYCHLPQKQKLYGVDPVGNLRKLRKEAAGFNSDPPFHARMMKIFGELRDQHTRYRPPVPYGDAHAFLPFRVEACGEPGKRQYIVTAVVPGFTHPTFGRGVEILRWNGSPIEQAVEKAGVESATDSARHCFGLQRLTYRALQMQPIPDDDTVQIHYRAGDQEHDMDVDWQVVSLPGACNACNEVPQLTDFQKFLYRPQDLCSLPIVSDLHKTPDGEFGYIRIFSFDMDAAKFEGLFKQEVAKYTNARGLIVDVRDNRGGSTRASERCLQWVAPDPTPIEPSLLYFVATKTTQRFCQLEKSVRDLGPEGLKPWRDSIAQALKTGAPFSEAFQYTNTEHCNDPKRIVFPRPVVVVTSGMTWSAGELFAAGFQDHGGTILGVDETTGGGGANFRNLSDLRDLFIKDGQTSPFGDLLTDANKANFQLGFRRFKRVKRGKGKELEDAGVQSNERYAMTRNDLLNGNQDLKNHAAKLLLTKAK